MNVISSSRLPKYLLCIIYYNSKWVSDVSVTICKCITGAILYTYVEARFYSCERLLKNGDGPLAVIFLFILNTYLMNSEMANNTNKQLEKLLNYCTILYFV